MAPTSWIINARTASPIIASGTVVITLVTCLIITKVNDIYTGGLNWPYFSDMGRDSPGYYIFCVGLTIVAISLCFTWYFNREFQKTALHKPLLEGHVSLWVPRLSVVCAALGIVSTIGLPVLVGCIKYASLMASTSVLSLFSRVCAVLQSFFSTSSYPSLHNMAAYWFFILETFAVFINTYVSYKIFKSMPLTSTLGETLGYVQNRGTHTALEFIKHKSVERTFYIQAVCASLFFIAFLLYIPIGLAVVAPFQHLTINECLERDLGEHYCTVTMKYNDVETKLWNYENDFSATQMRSAAQLCCILTLIGYSVSFLSHDVDNSTKVHDSTTPPVTNANARFIAIPMLSTPDSN